MLGGSGHIQQHPTAHSSIYQSRYYAAGAAPAVQYQAYTNGQENENPNAYGQQANGQQAYGQQAYGNSNYNDQNGSGRGKTRRYQIRRPAIQKEFFDIEEKVVIRPAGSALIELDSATVRPIAAHESQNRGDQSRNFNSAGQGRNNRYAPAPANCHDVGGSTQHQQFPSTDSYHPTTFSTPRQYTPTTYPSTPQYPTTTQYPITPQYPTSTKYPSSSQYPTSTYSSTPSYTSTDSYSSTPSYSSTTVQSPPRTFQPPYSDQTTRDDQFYSSSAPSSTPQSVSSSSPQQDIFVGSTTPVSVTIVDNNADSRNLTRPTNSNEDIIYARSQSSRPKGSDYQFVATEDEPDQFRGDLPPRGDVDHSPYKDTDQFYQELPRSRYTAPYQPTPFNVEARSNGDPTERSEYAEEYRPQWRQDGANGRRRNGTSHNERLIELYSGNGGASEVGRANQPQASGRYTDNGTPGYQNAGLVRARVVSTTPAPPNAQPSEHVNTRRIVVAKVGETVQEVEVPDNGTDSNAQYASPGQSRGFDNGQPNSNGRNCDDNNNQNANYRNENSNYNSNEYYGDNSNGNYYGNNGFNSQRSQQYNANDFNGQRSKQYNANDRSASGQFSESSTPSSFYIKTSRPAASQRIIYVKPVSQEFAERKASPPNQN